MNTATLGKTVELKAPTGQFRVIGRGYGELDGMSAGPETDERWFDRDLSDQDAAIERAQSLWRSGGTNGTEVYDDHGQRIAAFGS